MIKVGDKTVFLHISFYLPEDEVAEIELYPQLDEPPLLLSIAFKNTADENSSIKIVGNDQKGLLTFVNWRHSPSNYITAPVFFATTDRGEQVSFVGEVLRRGELFKIELQFMRGGIE